MKRLLRKTIILDKGIIPAYYKEDGDVSLEKLREYEDDFRVNVILVDMSPSNTGNLNPINSIIKI